MKKYATIYTQCVNNGGKMETKDKIKELPKKYRNEQKGIL